MYEEEQHEHGQGKRVVYGRNKGDELVSQVRHDAERPHNQQVTR